MNIKSGSFPLYCFAFLVLSSLVMPLPAAATESNEVDILFFGDSLTASADWQRYFPNYRVINEGLLGNDTQKALLRLDNILHSYKPSSIFIMLGINDIWHSRILRIPAKIDLLLPPIAVKPLIQNIVNYINKFYWVFFKIPTIMKNYTGILSAIHSEWPQTEIFVQSVLPVNYAGFYSTQHFIIDTDTINSLNQRLRNLSINMTASYIDLYPYLVVNSQLKKELSYDGIHLNNEGNTEWERAIEPYVKKCLNVNYNSKHVR